jgi:hypothetical protein
VRACVYACLSLSLSLPLSLSLSLYQEMHDYVSRVGAMQLRTTVRSDPKTGAPFRKTVNKRLLKVRDFRYVPTLGGAKDSLRVLSSDVRVALSEERVLDEDSLPPLGPGRPPLRVRIKQRRSFYYTPSNAERPVWRFDFTLVWAGRTFAQAQQRQMYEEPGFELECEFLDPPSCLAQQSDDWAVAEGLLLKLSDFLEPWGGYKLEPVFNREPRRQVG